MIYFVLQLLVQRRSQESSSHKKSVHFIPSRVGVGDGASVWQVVAVAAEQFVDDQVDDAEEGRIRCQRYCGWQSVVSRSPGRCCQC